MFYADIFCNVIDNYGDIGFCWRLSKNLENRYKWKISLWINNLNAFANIEKNINTISSKQFVNNISIRYWNDDELFNHNPGNIIINSFSCDLPNFYLKKIKIFNSLLINLEYLTPELWINKYHLLPSYNNLNIKKYFFFPGFRKKTGGIIREPYLSSEREKFQNDIFMKNNFLYKVGFTNELMNFKNDAKLIFIFCYKHSPIRSFIQALKYLNKKFIIILSNDNIIEKDYLKNSDKVKFHKLPLINQDSFDKLLWCSDINFIRGEDSFIRAIWAKRPFIWNIYKQDNNAHIKKLQAWLSLYMPPQYIYDLTMHWNNYQFHSKIFTNSINKALSKKNFLLWEKINNDFYIKQSNKRDLIDNLVKFCIEKIN
ncbi:hypothetical protein CKSOR_00172 [Candidatus Kinetoplastibacterium sorsogonicusi]|uniref:Protein-arginine rhamnosyltransferase n=1 Tax=Candidatus Kinetoplastidibacterium kentomonadis TaxID=1576550 RepID=A0A3S7J9F3_9PROT|nr:elongation factor P maturation arginine rhamnosyltransferase EarP [Candidatus Kinetoplastibacterium sorsogonicusi]AWD32302.1 hypothetical protein CKSOR_00172 [Candidatus Kinetoplastibacterium sorsogonicusi]